MYLEKREIGRETETKIKDYVQSFIADH